MKVFARIENGFVQQESNPHRFCREDFRPYSAIIPGIRGARQGPQGRKRQTEPPKCGVCSTPAGIAVVVSII